MTFEEILDQAIAMLQRRGRLTYGGLKRQFQIPTDLVVKYQAVDIAEIIFSLIWCRTSSKRRVETEIAMGAALIIGGPVVYH
jgi:hypothetical protein